MRGQLLSQSGGVGADEWSKWMDESGRGQLRASLDGWHRWVDGWMDGCILRKPVPPHFAQFAGLLASCQSLSAEKFFAPAAIRLGVVFTYARTRFTIRAK